MTRPTVFRRVKLGPAHRPTGATRHYRDGAELAPPTELQITQYLGEHEGFYLFYCDETGEEQTDTYHDSIDAAMRQAEREFGVTPEEWEVLVNPRPDSSATQS